MNKRVITTTSSTEADETLDGYTWRQMPGNCEDNQRMTFALFKKGQLDLSRYEMNPKTQQLRLIKRNFDVFERARRRQEFNRLEEQEEQRKFRPFGTGSKGEPVRVKTFMELQADSIKTLVSSQPVYS